jgi:hypothetical protein
MEVLKKYVHQPVSDSKTNAESDVLIRCRRNMAKIEEMIQRLGFVMGEIEGALGARNRRPPSNEARVLNHAAFAAGAEFKSPRD